MPQPRAFMFRNQARLNQVLMLMRLASLRVDTATDYASDIRPFLGAHDGHPPRTYRAAYDKTANPAGEVLLGSLWAPKTQISMTEVREKRALARPGQGDRECE